LKDKKARRFKGEKIVDRRLVGIHVVTGSRIPPSYYGLYEVSVIFWNGNVLHQMTKLERGHSVRSYPNFDDLNGTRARKSRSLIAFKPELADHMQAAAPLLKTMEYWAEHVDREYGMDFGLRDKDLQKKRKEVKKK
jgi:hypothetical protein